MDTNAGSSFMDSRELGWMDVDRKNRWLLNSDLKDLFISHTILTHVSLIASAVRRFQQGRPKPS
jgi:hypothetical protein